MTSDQTDPRCTFCGREDDIVADHILPKSRGGGYHPGNLQWLCCSCNSKKRNRTNEEYLTICCDVKLRPAVEEALALAVQAEAQRLVSEHGSVQGAIRALYTDGHYLGKPLPVEPVFGRGLVSESTSPKFLGRRGRAQS